MLDRLIGFCVVMMKNGLGSGCVCLFSVICCLVIVFSNVFCVCGGVWLILLVSSMWVNIGLGWNWNWWLLVLYIEMLSIFVGNRLEVNCMCWKLRLRLLVNVCVNVVLFSLGRFLMSRWLLESRVIKVSLIFGILFSISVFI